MSFILFLALYICAFFALFGVWALCVELGLIEFNPDGAEKEPPPKQPPSNVIELSPTVSKKERVRVRVDGVLRLVDVEDIFFTD